LGIPFGSPAFRERRSREQAAERPLGRTIIQQTPGTFQALCARIFTRLAEVALHAIGLLLIDQAAVPAFCEVLRGAAMHPRGQWAPRAAKIHQVDGRRKGFESVSIRRARRTHESMGMGLVLRLVAGLVFLVAVYVCFAGADDRRALPTLSAFIPDDLGQLDLGEKGGGRQIVTLDGHEEYHLRRQREIVDELSRKHLGSPLSGGELRDLRVLQELLDRRVLDQDQGYELQALGVVLGDVMARELGLAWVRVEDEFGKSRALRLDETETLIFPVTMISKRVEGETPFTIAELFEKARGIVADTPPSI